jgi:hypothetical protein
MDDDFKKHHEIEVKNMLKHYPCISLIKEDLIGYAENEYNAEPAIIEKIVRYIKELDHDDMQHIADDFTNDAVMYLFWHSVEHQLDLIHKEIC